MIVPPAACARRIVIAPSLRRSAGIGVLFLLPSCGGVVTSGPPSNDFSSGNFAMNIVASAACSSLLDEGRNRNWKIGLVKTGPSVAASMQGWSENPRTVLSQTNLAGTASGSSLTLTGYIYDTVDGCGNALCYRAEGTIAATQSGNVINGNLSGVLTYDSTTCTAPDHKVTFTRRQ